MNMRTGPPLDRVVYRRHAGDPRIRIRLVDDDDEPVDLSLGYEDFHARMSTLAAPEASVLAISDVDGTDTGFSISTADLTELPAAPIYLLTAYAKNSATGEYRIGQVEVVIEPAPAP